MGLNKGLLVGVLSTLTFVACSPKSSNSQQSGTSQIDSSSVLDSSGIIAGKNVSASDPIAKSIVGIYSQHEGEKGGAICTGSLLPGNLVLTAAHCLDDYMVIVFSSDINSAPESLTLPVDKAAVSPYWGSRQNAPKDHGDIALLHFEGTVPNGFVPATLLTDTSILRNGAVVTLAGYGANQVTLTPIDVKTYPDLIAAIQAGKVVCDDPMKLTNCAESSMLGAGTLRKTDVKIADSKFGVTEVLLDQTGGTGACHGDSGGPAYITLRGKTYLWGVTSRGEKDPKNNCSTYSVYTNAFAYKTWLNQVAKQLTASPLTDPNRLGTTTPAPTTTAGN